ncbi:MAG: hypothetical protein LUD72_11430 [Bacteroidales bacterium]|nr:hypothetical protein [Bacteroidales bacterium]
MIIYFANRKMSILGLASTELMENFTISDDLKTEDTDVGVSVFECVIHYKPETRAQAEECATAGNYILRSDRGDNEFYTIIETEQDTKNQSIYIYAEDAGMDLLNETVGAFEADDAYPAAYYVEKYAKDTGFEININEIENLTRKLVWTGEATAAERIASVATEFDNADISYSFEIKGLEISHKYINIHKKRGKDAGVQLRLNREVDRIVTTTSVADLATSLYVTGGTPEGEDDPITITGFDYDDGDFYVMSNESRLNSREALAVWSRYVWAKEPNQLAGYTGHIVKQWSYDTTSKSELVNRAITQLKKVCVPAVNYEIDIQQLPENVGIGDYVDIVDEQGELYLNSRILQLETSVCDQKQTATLGEFLIKDSGISQTVRELAEQFEQFAKSRIFYTWIAYADDADGNGISLDPTGKAYMGTATNRSTPDPDISDPSIYKWSLIQGDGIVEINTYYGVSDNPETLPTEWTTTPKEVLRNEYEWSYTEYVYESGRVEVTSPHIIAYYDYLEVDELDARVANIVNLLAGNAGVGELEAIYLTSDNAVIDTAVIAKAVAGTLVAELIDAEYINTDLIRIQSEDGGITIVGNQIQLYNGQIQIYDGETCRMQIGQDADGNFTFVLYDETGTGIMIDSEGIHASAVPDGLIVDAMVAEDAAISGEKLDIESICSIINENGDYVINAGSVVINDQSLDAWYTQITEQIEGLEGLSSEGLISIEPWFCLWDSDTEVPPEDADWVNYDIPVTDGLYKWVKWLGYYNDGHTEWSVPYCLSDGYIHEQTSILQTELEVVQGQITLMVQKTDFDSAVEGLETELSQITVSVGEIIEQVTDVALEMDSMDTRMSVIEETSEGITQAVYDIQQQVDNISFEGVTGFTTYFAVGSSSTEAPDGEWYDYEPKAGEDEYEWVRYLLEYEDGHTVWTTPYCLTDDYSRSAIQGAYSEISQLADEIEMRVYDLTNLIYSEIEVLTDSISLTVNNAELGQVASILLTVNGEEFEQELDLAKIRYAFAESDEGDVLIEGSKVAFASGTFEVYSQYFTVNAEGVITATKGYIANFEIEEDSLHSGKSAFASTADGVYLGTDGISLGAHFFVTNEGYLWASWGHIAGFIINDTALYNAKETFSTSGEGVYLGIDGIALGDDFSVNAAGYLKASAGHIGGFEITATSLYNGSHSSFSSTVSGVYLGSDGISLGSGFSVNSSGYLTAKSGEIGGWYIGTNSLYNGTNSMSSTTNGTYLGSQSGIRQYSGGNYVNITGSVLTNGNSSDDRAVLSDAQMQYYYHGDHVGNIGTNCYVNNNSQKGLVFDLDYQKGYMAWAVKFTPSQSTYTSVLAYANGEGVLGYGDYGFHLGDYVYAHGQFIASPDIRSAIANGYNTIAQSGTQTFQYISSITDNGDGSISWTWRTMQVASGLIISY